MPMLALAEWRPPVSDLRLVCSSIINPTLGAGVLRSACAARLTTRAAALVVEPAVDQGISNITPIAARETVSEPLAITTQREPERWRGVRMNQTNCHSRSLTGRVCGFTAKFPCSALRPSNSDEIDNAIPIGALLIGQQLVSASTCSFRYSRHESPFNKPIDFDRRDQHSSS